MQFAVISLLIVNAVAFSPRKGRQDLEGSGYDALVMRSEDLSSAEMPMEHRSGSLFLPDVFSIPRSLSGELGVDLWFSLFFVFLNDDVEEVEEDTIILAPANLTSQQATRWLEAEEKLTEELLLNHIIVGERLRPELLATKQTKTTLGGLDVVFSLSDQGNILVNGVKVITMQRFKRMLIVALEDYLFKEEVLTQLDEIEVAEPMSSSEPKDSVSDSDKDSVPREMNNDLKPSKNLLEPTPRSSGKNCTLVKDTSDSSIFKTITVCSEPASSSNEPRTKSEARTVQAMEIQEKGLEFPVSGDQKEVVSAIQQMQNDEASSGVPDILEQILTITAFFKASPGLDEFIHYARKVELPQFLNPDEKFTIIAPSDEAFRSWYPIDWGFNPFAVDNFVNETIFNHVIAGNINLNSGPGQELETLGGKKIKLEKNPESAFLNRVPVSGEMDLLSGKVVFVNEILFLDDEVVYDLNDKYGYLETGPLVAFPWFQSQFLSHSLRRLGSLPGFSSFTQYMNSTAQLGDYAPHIFNPTLSEGYTLFAPRDDAFWKILLADAAAPDPFEQNAEFRLSMLLGHLATGRHFLPGVENATVIPTLLGTNITLQYNTSGVVLLDGRKEVKALGPPIFVYNLGVILPIDSVLFVESSDVIAAMEALQPPQQENEEPHVDADVQKKGQDDNPEISFNVLLSQSEEGEKEGNAAVAPTSIDSIQFSTEPPVTLQEEPDTSTIKFLQSSKGVNLVDQFDLAGIELAAATTDSEPEPSLLPSDGGSDGSSPLSATSSSVLTESPDSVAAAAATEESTKEKTVRRIDDNLPFLGTLFEGLLPPRSEEDAAGSNDDQPDVPRRTKVFYVNNTRYEFEY